MNYRIGLFVVVFRVFALNATNIFLIVADAQSDPFCTYTNGIKWSAKVSSSIFQQGLCVPSAFIIRERDGASKVVWTISATSVRQRGDWHAEICGHSTQQRE